MNFKLFLEKTISEILSGNSEVVKDLKKEIKNFLQKEFQGRDLDVAVNLFSYIYHTEGKGDISKDWDEFKDYLKSNISNNRAIFVNPITKNQLKELNEKYHLKLKISDKNLRKGPKGLDVVDVSKELSEISKILNLPKNFNPELWNGWKWTSLGCGSSKQEAAAGGHCGNSGAKAGDNIFSLRNPNNQVLLTFVINIPTGGLGEAKGNNNQKPKKETHPAIVALLKSGYVKKIEGGGYLSENNFELSDLKYDNQLYEYFSKLLESMKQHKIPENYLPLNWATSLSDEIIHVKYPTAEQKKELLENIINVLNNHRVFDLDKEEKFKPIHLKINFKKLIEDFLKTSNNIKNKIEVYEKLTRIYSENRLWGKYNIKKYRPDLENKNIPEDEEGLFKDYVKKIESINIETDDILKFLNKLINNNLNLREKTSVLDSTLSAAGFGYNEHRETDFGKIITKLTNEIIDECLELKLIPKYVDVHLSNYIELQMNDDDLHGLILDFNSKKQTLDISIHKTYFKYEDYNNNIKEDEIIKLEIEKNFLKLKNELIKKGVPANQDYVKNHTINCSKEVIEEKYTNNILRLLTNNYKYLPTTNKSHLTKRFEIKNLLYKAKNKEKIEVAKNIKNELQEAREKTFNKIIKTINKIIQENFEKIFACVKKKYELYKRENPNPKNKTHDKKLSYEQPEQLSKERKRTKSFLQKLNTKLAYEKYEKERKERLKKQGLPYNSQILSSSFYDKMPKVTAETKKEYFSFKKWLKIKE